MEQENKSELLYSTDCDRDHRMEEYIAIVDSLEESSSFFEDDGEEPHPNSRYAVWLREQQGI